MSLTKTFSNRKGCPPYTTKDGSEIRELMHPNQHGCNNQSLAEAIVFPRCTTRLHKHHHSEEFYHVITGSGLMTLGEKIFAIETGDTICITPGLAHCVENTKNKNLVILCCCSPPYSHADTELL